MKKLTLILAALALTLSLSQCKKTETPTTDEGVFITLKAGYGNGAKTDFAPATGAFVWTEDAMEYIYVGGSNHSDCLGVLSGTGNGTVSMTFSGTLTTTPDAGETLYFFYLGKCRDGSAVSTLDFSSQDGTLENVTNYHIAISEGVEYTGQTSFSTTLNMKMAIAYFDMNGFKNASNAAETVYLHGDEVYSTATIDYQSGAITGSTKGNINLGTATAEKYVALIPSVSTETTLKFDSNSKWGAMNFLRGIQAGRYYSNSGAALTVTAGALPEGTLPGVYSISATKKVRFSKGNLQYTKSTSVWSFMEHQYDIVETLNQWVGYDYADQNTVSLFCYGTSGYNYGAAIYQPWSTTNSYAQCCGSNLYDINQADWGYNAIANGGNEENSGWRTLTRNEWSYLFNTRTASTVNNVANARYAKAQVAGVRGVILFSDSYTHPDGVNLPTGINAIGDTGWNGNNYTANDFELMEINGAVFLPAAGYRMGEPRVSNVGSDLQYWTSYFSGDNNGSKAASVNISSGGLDPSGTAFRCWGLSVRLVRDAGLIVNTDIINDVTAGGSIFSGWTNDGGNPWDDPTPGGGSTLGGWNNDGNDPWGN